MLRYVLALQCVLGFVLAAPVVAEDAGYTQLMAGGLRAYNARSFVEADANFQKALTLAANSRQRGRALFSLGVIAQKTNRHADARGYAQRALALLPDDAGIRQLATETGLKVDPSPPGRAKTAAPNTATPKTAVPKTTAAPVAASIQALIESGSGPRVWNGVGIQSSSSEWPMEVTFQGGDATVNYPSLGCTATWTRRMGDDNQIAFTETIMTGRGRCDDNGRVVISRRGTDQLSFGYSRSGSLRFIARAALVRGPYQESRLEYLTQLSRSPGQVAAPRAPAPPAAQTSTAAQGQQVWDPKEKAVVTAGATTARASVVNTLVTSGAAPKPDAQGFITSAAWQHAMFGTIAPCRVKAPTGLLDNADYLKRTIKTSDIAKIEVHSYRCDKHPQRLPSGKPEQPNLPVDVSTYYYLSSAYSSALFPKRPRPGCVQISGSMDKGVYKGPIELRLQFLKGDNSICTDDATEEENAAFFRKLPPHVFASNRKFQIYASNGHIHFDKQDWANADSGSGALAKALSLKVDIVSDDLKRVDHQEFTRLLRAKGTRAKIDMRYELAGKPDVLTADKYRVTLSVEVDLLNEVVVWGMGTTNTQTLRKDVVVELTRAKGYRASGVEHIASPATSTSGSVLFMKVNTNVVDAKSSVFVKKVETVK